MYQVTRSFNHLYINANHTRGRKRDRNGHFAVLGFQRLARHFKSVPPHSSYAQNARDLLVRRALDLHRGPSFSNIQSNFAHSAEACIELRAHLPKNNSSPNSVPGPHSVALVVHLEMAPEGEHSVAPAGQHIG